MNIPEVKLGIIAVSRDCFPIALSTQRRKNIVAAYGEGIYECPITVENEKDALAALADVRANGVPQAAQQLVAGHGAAQLRTRQTPAGDDKRPFAAQRGDNFPQSGAILVLSPVGAAEKLCKFKRGRHYRRPAYLCGARQRRCVGGAGAFYARRFSRTYPRGGCAARRLQLKGSALGQPRL